MNTNTNKQREASMNTRTDKGDTSYIEAVINSYEDGTMFHVLTGSMMERHVAKEGMIAILCKDPLTRYITWS